jgi:DNA-damage-inducible protein J
MVGGLPFELKQPRYNAETEAAMIECEELLASGNYKRYSDTKSMFADILAGDDDNV